MSATRRRVGRVGRVQRVAATAGIALRRLTAPLQPLFRVLAQLFQTSLLVNHSNQLAISQCGGGGGGGANLNY